MGQFKTEQPWPIIYHPSLKNNVGLSPAHLIYFMEAGVLPIS